MMRSGAMAGGKKARYSCVQLGSLFFVGRKKSAPAGHGADRRLKPNNLLFSYAQDFFGGVPLP